jgi:hypothetical protein
MVLMALSGTLSPVAHVLPAIDLAGRAVMERVFCLSKGDAAASGIHVSVTRIDDRGCNTR